MENLVKSIFFKLAQKRYFFKSTGYCKHKYPIVVNSIPKCGTNLILNIINSIPRTNYTGDFSMAAIYDDSEERLKFIAGRVKKMKKGDVYSGHVPYSANYANWLDQNNAKQIFIYRNPRDYTVSLYHYVMKDKKQKHAFYDLYKSFGTDQERLKKVILGHGKGTGTYNISAGSVAAAAVVFNEFINWLDHTGTLALKYEDIIGLKGKNKEIIQFINKIFSFLELENKLSNGEKLKIFEKGINPKKSHTFRTGKSGSWKKEYSQEHIKLFNDTFSKELLSKYKYSYPED